MKYCSNCGTQVPDNSKFCPTCGANIAQQTVQPEVLYPVPTPEGETRRKRIIIIACAVAVVVGGIICALILWHTKSESKRGGMTTEVAMGDSSIVSEIPLEATEGDQPVNPKVAESIINQYYAKLDSQKGCEGYFMARFRGNNYPVLCVLSGTMAADETLTLYAPDNSGQVRRLTPDVPAGNCGFYQADDSILIFMAHQGYAATSRITISGGKVNIEHLADQDLNATPGADYAEPNYPEVNICEPDDYSGIYSNMSEFTTGPKV